jgi:tetratricopeptide (TPR) repeat protein
VIPTPTGADEKTFATRTMTVAETRAELASFYLGTRQWQLARESATEAVKADPRQPLANEVLGFLDMGENKDDLSLREFSQAVDADSHMYLALFAKTMLSPLPHSNAPADRELFRATLAKVLESNPQFAPAFVEWAKSFAAEGNLARALPLARTAEKYQPWFGGYHLLTAEILLRSGHPADAGAIAAYVANRWRGPDHDEAMELWNRVPAAQRPKDAPADVISPGLQSVQGKIKSVECEPKGKEWALTLDRDGQPSTFKIKGSMGGYSDTLWFGEHFNNCYHVAGLRAVLRYKPAADKSTSDEVVSWGFRDDLPVPPSAAASASPAPASVAPPPNPPSPTTAETAKPN